MNNKKPRRKRRLPHNKKAMSSPARSRAKARIKRTSGERRFFHCLGGRSVSKKRRLDKSNAHLFSRPLLSKDRLSGVNPSHVHLAVKAVDPDGARLNPRKTDLQHWRETFAEKLREQSIDANPTPRKARGVAQKAEQ